ncbi:uncharacterized protein HD556DRAFT_1422971 [Suillus plorans]|uniref:Uncharacterized protein n=1 Tax=Suillus plorans TaxID=116603 RepID=A0A9P7DAV0_9AGAM|nr:uncharacterized protein HD556DRAFT_1422971 [Suillus plorans]KAG1785387.1 hypothetical protein HD556DRAFT_1422971 [Suillus plorans]
MIDAPVQDWGSIDESNITELRNDISMFRRRSEEYSRLNSSLDTILEMKAFATENQVCVPGLPKLLELYSSAVAQGKHIQKQSWWKKIRKMRDWEGSEGAFKRRCERVWLLAHQTSTIVNHEVSKVTIGRVSIRRRRSLDGLVGQAEPDLVQRHNQHGDTATTQRSTPPNTGVVAQSSSTTNMLSEETIRKIADLSAAKILERLSGRPPGGISQTVNHFHGCIVRPGRGAAPTVNFGGKNNRGADIKTSPTEGVEWNGADDIDGISDDESNYDTATDATRSGSGRHSGSAISLAAQSMQSPAGTSRSLSGT